MSEREPTRPAQRDLFEAPTCLGVSKFAELAAWDEGRAPRPSWFRQSRPGVRQSLETGRPNRAPGTARLGIFDPRVGAR